MNHTFSLCRSLLPVLLLPLNLSLLGISTCGDPDDTPTPTDPGVDNDHDGWTLEEGDCNDHDSTVHPEAVDNCGDFIDSNCDGQDDRCLLDPDLELESADLLVTSHQLASSTGERVVNVGDVNGDGHDDVLVTAPSYRLSEDPTDGMRGRACLFYGPLSDTRSMDDADACLVGSAPYSVLGSAAAPLGDINHSSKAAFAVSASGYTDREPREAFIFAGNLVGELSRDDAQAWIRLSDSYNNYPTEVASAGDVDGDGELDFAVSSPDESRTVGNDVVWGAGKVRIFRGPLSGELHAEDAVAVLTSNYSESTTGTALSSGDFNGDGIVDMAVGQSELRAVVIFAGPLAGELSEEDALSQIYRETGFDGFSKFGSVMGAGDLNGDGKLDLAVGAPQSSTKESTTVGVVELFLGPFQGTRTVKAGDVELTSGISYDYFGKSLVIRDLNEDGALDLLAGAPSNVYPLAGSNRGCFYTYYGPFEGDGTGADPILLACASSLYTESGLSLTVGELNGHEGLDVLVGAPSLSDDSTLGGGARLVDHGLLP